MDDQQTIARRRHMKARARKRQKSEKVSYSVALFRVRRSEILLLLSRAHENGSHLTYRQVSDATGVPPTATRQICNHIRKTAKLKAVREELVSIDAEL